MMRSSRRLLSRKSSQASLASLASYTSEVDSEWSYPTSSASSVIDFALEDDLDEPAQEKEEQPSSSTYPNSPPTSVYDHPEQGYSIFYLKLDNGKWLVRCRNAERKIIATYEVDGSM
ncbi:hypothetical protein DM01DRAFT_1333490, partial [Hesseltinella vesiculosa]